MKIAVASCAKFSQRKNHPGVGPDQPAWKAIQDEQPDLLLLGGDNIYILDDEIVDATTLRNELKSRYDEQFGVKSFTDLLAALGDRVIAIYDDHDFLGNDRCGGSPRNKPLRDPARQAFIERFHPPQTGEDVYSFTSHGLVDVIALDGRYYRTRPKVSKNSDAAILGAKQWTWLKDAIKNSTAPYLLVLSGTTFHDFGATHESWALHYPAAYKQLHDLLAGRPGALVVSGDIHKNAHSGDDGVIEVVTSAVARKAGPDADGNTARQNYAILTFDEDKMLVQLRSNQNGRSKDHTVPLSNWVWPVAKKKVTPAVKTVAPPPKTKKTAATKATATKATAKKTAKKPAKKAHAG